MKKTVVLALLALLALLAILVWNNVVWDNAISRKKEVPADGHNHELCLSRENDWYEMIQPTSPPTMTDEKEMTHEENLVPTPLSTKPSTPDPAPTNEEVMIPKQNPVPAPTMTDEKEMTPEDNPVPTPLSNSLSNSPSAPTDEKVMTPKESNQPN